MRHYHWIWFSSSSVTVSSESISWICLIHSETNWIEQWYDILYFHLPSASAPILIILSTRIFGVQSENKKDFLTFIWKIMYLLLYPHSFFLFQKSSLLCLYPAPLWNPSFLHKLYRYWHVIFSLYLALHWVQQVQLDQSKICCIKNLCVNM